MPGSGKSHKVHENIIKNELAISNSKNIISTVFHPEYSYGDFMGKLLPITNSKKQVEYNYFEGFFLKALAQAYKSILNNTSGNTSVVLIIDEINRGNSAAIFGTVFQLLDRNNEGWSSYSINISDMEFNKLIELIGLEKDYNSETYRRQGSKDGYETLEDIIKETDLENIAFSNKEIRIPPNLSIIGTMNTSDESIYYMDSAFKRRWDWEYINNYWGKLKMEGEACPEGYILNNNNGKDCFILKDLNSFIDKEKKSKMWVTFVDNINNFLIENSDIIRGIEDKQIGYWFIKATYDTVNDCLYIPLEKIKNKLMFFLWDSVFSRDKEPLNELLSTDTDKIKLKTFGEFQEHTEKLIDIIMDK